ncbi:MAG: exodeoxyribonuclease VII large subunit [Nanoarchaeota archaeon]|nr:exodeoxyribonuclease VII large subunit [Nanoarchaeota archaeon]
MDSFVRFCGILFLVMLVILMIFAGFDAPPLVFIKDIATLKENQAVQVVGVVTKISEFKGTTFLTIKDGDVVIDAVVFDSVKVVKGAKVLLSGKISVYKDKKELIIDSIKIL